MVAYPVAFEVPMVEKQSGTKDLKEHFGALPCPACLFGTAEVKEYIFLHFIG